MALFPAHIPGAKIFAHAGAHTHTHTRFTHNCIETCVISPEE
jgi:hypothetical protein